MPCMDARRINKGSVRQQPRVRRARLRVGGEGEYRRVFTYTLVDYDAERDGDEEAWAAKLAEQGWRMWEPGPGPLDYAVGRRL